MFYSNYIIMEEMVINLVQLNKYSNICNKEYSDLVTYRCIDTTSASYIKHNCDKLLHNYNMCMTFKTDKLLSSSDKK